MHNIINFSVWFVITPQLAFAIQPARVLRATGAEVVEVKPDQAKLTCTIQAHADTPASAISTLVSQTVAIFAAFEIYGLPKQDLASTFLSPPPTFRYIDLQPTKLLEYSATARLYATINRLPSFPVSYNWAWTLGGNKILKYGFPTKYKLRYQS